MMDKTINVSRHWPILYILNKNISYPNHFFLQKYIFLSKFEAKVPIDYIFKKDTHGPYCIDIKTDARDLAEKELINMEWDSNNRWQLSINEKGKTELNTIYDTIPEKWKKRVDGILDKYQHLSVTQLERLIYKKYIKEKKETDAILANTKENIQSIRNKFKEYSPSYNQFLLLGSLEYCLVAINKIKISPDIVKRNYFISAIYDYVTSISEVFNIVESKPGCLSELDLRDVEDTFYFVQQICKEIGNFPALEELDLAELSNLPA